MQKLLSNAKALKCDGVSSDSVKVSQPGDTHVTSLFVCEQQGDEEAEPGACRQAAVPAGAVGDQQAC